MLVYLDTSVIIRVLFGERNPLSNWGRWQKAYSSRLWHVEALRVLDRARIETRCHTKELIQLRRNIDIIHSCLEIVPASESILLRAGESFPTNIGTLDAIHLATALHIRESVTLDVFLTHDRQLADAAATMGFSVAGV